MSTPLSKDPNAGLARQALRRELTAAERCLAEGLEQIFKSGVTDFAHVTALLQQSGVRPPSGAEGAWTVGLLHAELAAINATLDRAYESGGGP